MASVLTAARTDGAPPLELHRLDNRFVSTRALKVVNGTWLDRAKIFTFNEPTVGVTSTPNRKSIGCRPSNSRRVSASQGPRPGN